MGLVLDIVIFMILFIVIPYILGSVAVYFLVLAIMTHRANPNEYERLRRVTGSVRNALNGQVSDGEDGDVHNGIAWDRERKCLVSTSSISDNTLDRVFGKGGKGD